MGPEPAVARRVRITFLVRVLMVHAVGGDPEDRPALERQRAADRQEILERLRRLEAAMGVQPVIAEADAEADREPVQHQRDEDVGPGEEPERRDAPTWNSTMKTAVIQLTVDGEYAIRLSARASLSTVLLERR